MGIEKNIDQHKRSRRNFLKKAGSTALTLSAVPLFIPASALGRDGHVPPSERVLLGAIGVGGMGLTDSKNFLGIPEAQIIAICDADERHLEIAQGHIEGHQRRIAQLSSDGHIKTYVDFRELLARSDIDAVYIATPPHTHAMLGVYAMMQGKDVYGEKPMARTIRDCRLMADTAKKLGRVFQHGTQTRSHQPVRDAVQRVRNGFIGQVRRIEVGIPGSPTSDEYHPKPVPKELHYDLWLGPAPLEPYIPERVHGNFRYYLEYSAGVITDLGTHYLDISQWVCGHDLTGPVRVIGSGTFPKSGLFNTPNSYHFKLEFADGIVYDCSSRHPQGIKVIGDEGWIYMPLRHPLPEEPITASNPSILRGNSRARSDIYVSNNHWKNFIDCVKTRQKPVAHEEIACRSTTLPHLGSVLLEAQTSFQWDPVKEQITDKPELNKHLDRAKRPEWANLYTL